MTFFHPILAAAAIAAVSVPIIIHILMRRRRRPVMWAAMRFLLEAYRQHRRRLRLEQILLLAARCLVIALAGLAIARPLLGQAGLLGGRGAVTLYLLVDNGLAGAATDEAAKSALERHKARALSLLDQLDTAAGDRAALIALGGPAQALVVPPSTSTSGLRDQINALSPTDSATDIPGGLSMVRSALEGETQSLPGGRTVVAVLSDFLTGSADPEHKLAALLPPGARPRDLVLLASPVAARGLPNTTITAVDPLRPVVVAPKRDTGAAEPVSVTIALRRSGPAVGEAAASTVRLALHTDAAAKPAPVGQAVIRWNPGQPEATTTASINLVGVAQSGAAGSVVLTASIDSDSITGDNTFRRPIEVRQSLRVGLIAPRRTGLSRPGLQQFEPADWFRLALSPLDTPSSAAEPEIDLVDLDPGAVDAGRLAGLDAAIILAPQSLPEGSWRRLRAFADAGGLIVVCPPVQATVHLWADAMVRDLALPWTVARESRTLSQPGVVSPERPAQSRDLLAVLAPELRDLLPPVRVFQVLPVETAPGAAPPLLALENGTPLLLAAHPGSKEAAVPGQPEPPQRGLIVFLAAALAIDWTDLQTKPLMVPLAHEIVKQGVGQARGGRTELAGSTPELPGRAAELRAVGDASPAIVRARAGRAEQPLRRAGLWRALDESGATRALLAVNADPAGARTDPQPATAISTWLAKAAGGEVQWLEEAPRSAEGGAGVIRSVLQHGDDSGRLVLPLLIAAMVLALLELGMARWFSHAVIVKGGPGLGGGAPREGAPA